MSDIQAKVAEAVDLLKEASTKVDTIDSEVTDLVDQYVDTYDDLSDAGGTLVGALVLLRELGLIEFKEIK